MRYLVILLAGLMVGYFYVQPGSAQVSQLRYQMVPVGHGPYAVFRIDGVTGAVSYCTVTVSSPTSPITGVNCVGSH